MRRIAVVTSGGDAPGMNAAIRAVVRTGLAYNLEVVGVRRGFHGLLLGEFEVLGSRDVAGIIQRGGTILQTSRSREFRAPEGVARGRAQLQSAGIEGLVVIGGGGSMAGGEALANLDFPVVGIPASIDNDLHGTDIAIGVDTALNTAIEAIDRIKETASSHNRAFVIQVMGRCSGYLALMAGVAGGAEVIVVPEVPFDPQSVVESLDRAYQAGKTHFIVVVAEGAEWNGPRLCDYLDGRLERRHFETRLTILGHVQRGGTPTAFDRILATKLGIASIECLLGGQSNLMVGLVGRQLHATPLRSVVNQRREIDRHFYEVARLLA